jgi:DNA-binding Lrp family transcriptional regulator
MTGSEATPQPFSIERLDDLDREILRLLSQDARQSVRAIARHTQMSPGAISERIARLERAGVVLGYHAVVDPVALGFALEAIIAIQTEQGPSLADTLDRLMNLPEVESAQVVTGRWDLVVRVRARDHWHLRNIVLDKIWGFPGFRHSETMVVYDTRHRDADWNIALSMWEEAKSSEHPAPPAAEDLSAPARPST